MCFSATASIGASLVLSAVGIAGLRQISEKNQTYLALIPFLFAIQQLSEGFVWLSLQGVYPFTNLEFIMKNIFLFFAVAVWPFWISFSLLMVETNPRRSFLLWGCLLMGLLVGCINLYEMYVQHVQPQIFYHSIYYTISLPTIDWLYFIATIIPCFISSLRSMWLVGSLIAVSALVAAYLYYDTYVSVWCFFGAIVSVSIYKVIRDNFLEKATVKVIEK